MTTVRLLSYLREHFQQELLLHQNGPENNIDSDSRISLDKLNTNIAPRWRLNTSAVLEALIPIFFSGGPLKAKNNVSISVKSELAINSPRGERNVRVNINAEKSIRGRAVHTEI